MSSIIRVIFAFVVSFQPPVLFYLKRKLKWRIHSVLLGFLSFLLGWLLFLLLGLLVSLDSTDYPRWFVILLALTCGVFASGGLLLFWSPVIVLFSVKNKKVKLAMVPIIIAFVSFIGLVWFSDRYDLGVPGNRLIQKGSSRTGFDGSSNWVFEAKNDLLKQKMMRKWKLKPMSAYPERVHPISFSAIGKDKPEWWPSSDVLDSLEGYGWIHDSDELYRSLWYDPNNQRLYLERGNW